jgi:hypothetical protein
MPTTNYDTPFGDDLFEAKTAKELQTVTIEGAKKACSPWI